jgi:hypothetical protein
MLTQQFYTRIEAQLLEKKYQNLLSTNLNNDYFPVSEPLQLVKITHVAGTQKM